MEPLLYVLYDGPCALCQGVVRLALRRPAAARCRFVPLAAVIDTPEGERLERRLGEPIGDTVVVLRGAEVLVRSDAVLALHEALGPAAWLVPWLRRVPRAWRDRLYGWVAAHRQSWFGRAEGLACERPAPGQRPLLLEALPPDALP